MSDEVLMVCQVPKCFEMADTWHDEGHDYFYCHDHATELGWCTDCEQYVGTKSLYTYGLCADCLENAPEFTPMLDAAIDEVLSNEPRCPHCDGVDVALTHDGGYCNSCNQVFDGG